MPDLSPSDIENLVRGFFATLCADVGVPVAPEGEEYELWAHEQHGLLEQHVLDLEHDLQTGKCPGLVGSRLETYMGNAGEALSHLQAQTVSELKQGAVRAEMERARFIKFRLDEPLKPYKALDELFLDAKASKVQFGGPSVSVAVKQYLAEHKSEWTNQTRKDIERTLGWFVEAVGSAKPLQVVSKDDIVAFRKALLRLKKRAATGTFTERQTDNASKQISLRTAGKYLSFASSFFAWAVGEAGHLSSNPSSGVVIKFKKQKSAASKSATPAALKAFFESPLFHGHHYLKFHRPGLHYIRGDEYWLFVLQALTGMRAGEVAQLQCTDVTKLSGVPVIQVRTTDALGSAEDNKTTKNESSIRNVPIPTLLFDLGFQDFVTWRGTKSKVLLPRFNIAESEKKSDLATKFATRYLERIGQKQPGKATHWLRHACIDALRNAGAPDHVISQIDGHTLGGMAGVYGMGASLSACAEWIGKADFGFDIKALLLSSQLKWEPYPVVLPH